MKKLVITLLAAAVVAAVGVLAMIGAVIVAATQVMQ